MGSRRRSSLARRFGNPYLSHKDDARQFSRFPLAFARLPADRLDLIFIKHGSNIVRSEFEIRHKLCEAMLNRMSFHKRMECYLRLILQSLPDIRREQCPVDDELRKQSLSVEVSIAGFDGRSCNHR